MPKPTTKELQRQKAERLIERRDVRVLDLAVEYGQIFDNVKHMTWFVDAVVGEVL